VPDSKNFLSMKRAHVFLSIRFGLRQNERVQGPERRKTPATIEDLWLSPIPISEIVNRPGCATDGSKSRGARSEKRS
jgi:hypothetical protein